MWPLTEDRYAHRVSLWRRGLAVVLAAISPWALAAIPGGPPAEKASSEEVEAAYLYNFGKFVRWPENADHQPFIICVAERQPLEETVKRLVAGEQIAGRRVEVHTVDRPEVAGTCSILYLGVDEPGRLDAWLKASLGKPVLTVGNSPEFLARGGILQFVLVGDHVRFSANLEAALRNGLLLSSELLKVAVSVRGSERNGGGR